MKSIIQQLTGRSLDVIVALTLGYQWLRENKDGGLVMLCPPCFLDFRHRGEPVWIKSEPPPEPISDQQLCYVSLYHSASSYVLELGTADWYWATFQSAEAITIMISVSDGDILHTVADVRVWRRDFPTLEEALATTRCWAFLQAKERSDG